MDVSELLKQSDDKKKAITVSKDLPCTIDLGLLAIFDPNPLPSDLYLHSLESTLLSHTRDGIQLLVNAIWSQPTRIVSEGVVASLPPIETELPREKPLPNKKAMTKWEAFAATKGIAPKPRKERLVWDEEKQDWVPRWGYKGKNKEVEDQWIVEIPANKDPNFDPVSTSKSDRKSHKLKNESQRLKNLQRAAANAANEKPTAASNAAAKESRKRDIERELKVTKGSTASMGVFDAKLKGEGREKNVKRKFAPTETPSSTEQTTSLAFLSSIGATPSNKRNKVSDDAPESMKRRDGEILNSRKAVKHLTGGRGAMSLEGKRGGRGRGRGRGRK